ncbi:MAG TPA: 3-hydroxyacyl-CoA dehydrogenase NAD-binding domain-containing protein [Pseudomonadales bacterium]|nr:3-hydroxyacyl-CoA dehydrogenase NAD-binding domain-containing protein [Pseudomonadales bacterium]
MALIGTVHYEVRDGVALLTIDNPPVNPLSSGVRFYLSKHLETAIADPNVKAIVVTGKGRAFIAGADIRDFGKSPSADEQPKRPAGAYIEESAKPVVAAINGTAFGGGLEFALTCHYRVAAPGAPVGLPEIKIGLLPGGGGTQRLPRLIGAKAAMDAILSGDPFETEDALRLGIVDEIIQGDLVAGAIAFAKAKAQRGGPHPLVRDRSDKVRADRANPNLFKDAQAFLARRLRGQFNGQMAYECVKAAVELDSFDAGMKVERDNFQKCLTHPQRAAMIHVFFAERQAARVPDVPADTPKLDVKSAATVGAGLMGGGIAMNFANVGIPVTVLEMNDEALQKGLGVIKKNYARMVDGGRITQAQMDERVALIKGTTEYADIGSADVVIEAVYENLDLKKEIFKKLDATMKKGAILASNTSALDIDQMAAMTARPESVVGMHFFSPANVMQLLEVVRGEKSSKQSIATAMALGKTIDKIPVLSKNARGFIGNRMLGGYTQQAGEIILQGALPEQVDKVIYDFGFNMGPFAMNDLVGLDLGWRARKMSKMKPEDVPLTARVVDKLCELGRFGQKTNAGFYKYAEGSRQGQPDAEVAKLIVETSNELGIKRRTIADDEVLKRCLYPLINIGAELLETGVALRSSDIDVVYVYGYGFPKYRGGPMYYADQIGLDKVYQDILKFHQEYGEAWKPSALLARLAKAGKTFASLTAE